MTGETLLQKAKNCLYEAMDIRIPEEKKQILRQGVNREQTGVKFHTYSSIVTIFRKQPLKKTSKGDAINWVV